MLYKGVKKYFQGQEPQKAVWYSERNTDLRIKILLTSQVVFLHQKVNSDFYLIWPTNSIQQSFTLLFLIHRIYLLLFGFPSASLDALPSLLCSFPLISPASNSSIYSQFRTWTSSGIYLYSSVISKICLPFTCCSLPNLFLHGGLLL